MTNIGNGAVEGQVNQSITSITANYTVLTTDENVEVTTSTSTITVTLPAPVAAGSTTAAAANPVLGVTGQGNQGQRVSVIKIDSGNGKVVVNGGSKLNVGVTYTLNNQWSSATFLSDGTEWYLITSVS
jgi:hypothetical protein